MKKAIAILLLLVMILTAVVPFVSSVTNTDYDDINGVFVTEDFVDDAAGMDVRTQTDFCWTHYFDPEGKDIQSATLTIRAQDLDGTNTDPNPIDEVVSIDVDGAYIGDLDYTGDMEWGETEFTITDPSIFDDGEVEVCVDFDVLGGGRGYNVTIDWSKLVVEWLSEESTGVTKEIVDAEYYYGISPYFTPVEIFTNACWDLEIKVSNWDTAALDDIWVYDSIGAHIKLVEQPYEDTYTETITDATGMDVRTQTDFCWTHYFDPEGKDIQSATLTIYAQDIDGTDPVDPAVDEVVSIYVDGTDVGDLVYSGNELWSTTEFIIIDDFSIFEDGEVEVCVDFDVLGGGSGYKATIDWSELSIEYDYDYIFSIDGNPVPLDGDDTRYFGGENGENLIWKQANNKDPIKNPCATNLMWNIDSLDIGESSTLKFRVETIEFPVGNKNPVWKQAFTSSCHHSLNDGAIAVVYYDEEYHTYVSNPVVVSVYDPDLEADSDTDGLYDLDEVNGVSGYVTDPCNCDTDGDGFGDGDEIDHGADPTDQECFPPSFTQADLVYSTDLSTWDPALDYDYAYYEVELDGEPGYYYLNLDNVDVAGLPLADGYYGFYLKVYPDEDFIDVYWAGRGVEEPPNEYAWQDVMWDIINGDLPMFFIKVDGTDYMLVDGLMEELYGPGADMPLQVDGDYYLGVYDFEGTIENTCGALEDVEITIEFSPTQSILQSVVMSGADNVFGNAVGETLTFTFSENIYFDGTAQKVYFAAASSLGTAVPIWSIVDNVLTITAPSIFVTPRPAVGDYVTDFDYVVDVFDNDVIVPAGGVEVVHE